MEWGAKVSTSKQIVMIFRETDKQTYSTYLTQCHLTERQLKNYDLDNFGNAIVLSDFS